MDDVQQAAAEFRQEYDRLLNEIGTVIVGGSEIVEGGLTALFTGGHCLLEGVPGLGKTMLVRTMADALHCSFSRIQFTPDLMPADIIGTNMVVENEAGGREYTFRQGPIFANIVLADEINRATPKTQSALLEAMQEKTVSVARTTHKLDPPFFVMATQNPIEMEGTYPLPEAQLDRFIFKLLVRYPSHDELVDILNRTTHEKMLEARAVMDGPNVIKWQTFVRQTPVAPKVMSYAVRLVLATQPTSDVATEMVRKYVRFGSSPRGAQGLVLASKVGALRDGRYNVGFEDIRRVALPTLRHRVLLNFEGEADQVTPDAVIEDILANVDPKE